jgi:uncharacterized protein YodC (DUF2158 family)
MAKFQPGDIVKLKSGGPNMTVEGYETLFAGDSSIETNNVQCSWFNGNTIHKELFQDSALEIATTQNP